MVIDNRHLQTTMITTTRYGTWLPGDCRGYVQNGIVLPPNSELERRLRLRMRGRPVYFSPRDEDELFDALTHAVEEFGYKLSDVTVLKTGTCIGSCRIQMRLRRW